MFDTAACTPRHSAEVSPEGVGIAGVLWSTLRRCIGVELREIHGHSSSFRLRDDRTV